ncbi:hypothetical protein Trydic_g16003 [Trypoxylus dichotomus]
MLHQSQLEDIDSNASKVVISMSKNGWCPKIRNLRNCLILICLQHWMLIESSLENTYARYEFFRRQEIENHTQLKERNIERYLVTCQLQLQRQERRVFHTGSSLAIKNGMGEAR